jgi:prepilin-type N-terminal cleavage/methylation domain-containing protein
MNTKSQSIARRGFTLVELLIVMLILSILSAMALTALSAAAQEGKRQRAKLQITKIDSLIMEKWNSYRFRQLPIKIPAGTDPRNAATIRLYAMRDLMRLEMPDHIVDVFDGPAMRSKYPPYPTDSTSTSTPYLATPALTQSYRRMIPYATYADLPNYSYDQAECLYLILSQLKDGDRSALNFFFESEIGDVDGDRLKEILDPWGTPIMFLRAAPGYSAMLSNDASLGGASMPAITTTVSTTQIPNGTLFPDAFDPLKVDTRWSGGTNTFKPFFLKPLIYSAGPDKGYDIYIDPQDPAKKLRYREVTPVSDPYTIVDATKWMGLVEDTDKPGESNHGDNITNHDVALEGQ